MTYKAVIKWRGEKKIINVELRDHKDYFDRLVYFSSEYCMYLESGALLPPGA